MTRRKLFPLALAARGWAQRPRLVIGMGGIMHESNSFNPARTTLADYSIEEPAPGNDQVGRWRRSSSELSGGLEGAEKAGVDIFPALLANATPKGPLTRDTFDALTARLIAKLKSAPKLDGIYLTLHGAMVVEGLPHGDAEIVRRVRQAFGPGIPVAVTHDFHANVSEQIVAESTLLITYKQTPHLDTKDRGIQAVTLLARTLRGEVKPVQRVAKPPMVYNIVFQNTYAEPMLPIVRESIRLEQDPRILAVSVPGGYQYADVPAMGPSVVVVTDNDPALAERESRRLADMLWATRDRIVLRLPDAAGAVRQAMAATRFPVALFDTGDNIGGGSAGDSTFILEELLRQRASGWVVVIADPAAVQAAAKSGIGARFEMPVGGKTDNMHGKPVLIRGVVRSLHAGKYLETEVRHGGSRYHELGLAAVIEGEGSTPDLQNLLLVTTRRSNPNSLHQIISCGIYPERQRILVAKGTIAPRAAYEPVAAQIIPVDTPGATAVNPARFRFQLARKGLFGMPE